MDLVSRLQEDMKAAMKAGEKEKLTVIRMLLSDAKNADLKKITPEEAVLAYGKKLAKSAEEFDKYGKPEEAAQLRKELSLVETYLPKKASAEDTAALVDTFLAAGSYTEKQAGQATGAFMKAHGATVDPGTASKLIREKLKGK